MQYAPHACAWTILNWTEFTKLEFCRIVKCVFPISDQRTNIKMESSIMAVVIFLKLSAISKAIIRSNQEHRRNWERDICHNTLIHHTNGRYNTMYTSLSLTKTGEFTVVNAQWNLHVNETECKITIPFIGMVSSFYITAVVLPYYIACKICELHHTPLYST